MRPVTVATAKISRLQLRRLFQCGTRRQRALLISSLVSQIGRNQATSFRDPFQHAAQFIIVKPDPILPANVHNDSGSLAVIAADHHPPAERTVAIHLAPLRLEGRGFGFVFQIEKSKYNCGCIFWNLGIHPLFQMAQATHETSCNGWQSR